MRIAFLRDTTITHSERVCISLSGRLEYLGELAYHPLIRVIISKPCKSRHCRPLDICYLPHFPVKLCVPTRIKGAKPFTNLTLLKKHQLANWLCPTVGSLPFLKWAGRSHWVIRWWPRCSFLCLFSFLASLRVRFNLSCTTPCVTSTLTCTGNWTTTSLSQYGPVSSLDMGTKYLTWSKFNVFTWLQKLSPLPIGGPAQDSPYTLQTMNLAS